MENKKIYQKRILAIVIFMLIMSLNMTLVFAADSGDIGQKAADWIYKQAQPLILVATIVTAYFAYVKGGTSKAVITLIVGGVFVYLAGNSNALKTIGEAVGGAIFGS